MTKKRAKRKPAVADTGGGRGSGLLSGMRHKMKRVVGVEGGGQQAKKKRSRTIDIALWVAVAVLLVVVVLRKLNVF